MNLPTKITVSRIVLIVLMMVGLFVLSLIPNLAVPFYGASGEYVGINLVYLIVFIVFVVASSTDYLDGHIARKYNMVTDLGKFLDPIADKLLVNCTFIFLILVPSYATGSLGFPLFCAILLVARDLVVDTLRVLAAKKQIVLAANIFGKAKTVMQMVAIGAILLNDWPFAYFDITWPEPLRVANLLVYLATFLSVLSGIIYVVSNKNVLKEKEIEKK